MTSSPTPVDPEIAARRRRARRTAWLFAAIALVIYAGVILSRGLGR